MTIYTWGDTAFLESIWTGLGHIFSGGVTYPLIASALLLNLIIGIIRKIGDMKAPLMWNFWISIFIFIIFFSPQTNVSIKQTNGSAARVIAGEFPVGIVAPVSFISRIGYGVSNIFRDAIVPVNTGLGFSSDVFSTGGIEPLRALVYMRNMSTIGAFSKSDLLINRDDPGQYDSGIFNSVGEYFQSCIARAVTISEIDNSQGSKYKDIFTRAANSPSQWDSLLIDQAGWPIDITLNGQKHQSNCSAAHSLIKSALQERSTNIAKSLTGRTGISTQGSDENLQEKYLNAVNLADKLDVRQDGAKSIGLLSQNLLTNTLISGACKDASELGPSIVQSCISQFDSVQQRRFQEASKSGTFTEMIIPLVTFIEGFVYMLSPIMMVLLMLLGAQGVKIVGKYCTALVWVMLMPVCQVAVDVYLNVYFNRWLNTVVEGESSGMSIWSINGQESAWTELASFVAFAGTAQAMVPALAMFILFAGVHTMQGMAVSASGAPSASGTLHADTAVAWKGGAANTQTQTYSMVNDTSGMGVASSAKGLGDSGADNTNLKVASGNVISRAHQSQSQATTNLAASAENAKSRAIDSSMGTGVGFDVKAAASLGVSQRDSMAYSIADKFGETYKWDKDTTGRLAKELKANLSGGLGASAGVSTGENGGVGAKAQADLKAGLLAALAKSEVLSEELGHSLDANQIKGIVNSSTEDVTKVYNEMGSKSLTASDTEKFSEQWAEAYKTNAAYQEAKQELDTLANIQSGNLGADVSIGDAISSISKSVLGTKNLLGEQNLFAAQSSLIKDFTGVDVGPYQSNWDKNITSDQLTVLSNNLDDQEIKSLNKFGMDISRNDDGSLDFNKKSNSDAIKQISGTSMSPQEIDDFLSGRPNALSNEQNSALRSELIRGTLTGMNDLYSDVDTNHFTEALRAEGRYFDSVGNSNLGFSGEDSTGKYGSFIGYGAKVTDIANSSLAKQSEALDDVNLSDQHGKLRDNGVNAVNASADRNVSDVGTINGNTSETIADKKQQLVSDKNAVAGQANHSIGQAKNMAEGIQKTMPLIDTGKLTDEVSDQYGHLARKASEGLNSQLNDINGDATTVGVNDFLDSDHSHIDLLGVSDRQSVALAKGAHASNQEFLAAAENIKDFANESTRLAEQNGDKDAFTQSLVNNGMSADDARAATDNYFDKKASAENAIKQVQGDKGALNAYALLTEDSSLMNEPPTAFRNAMEGKIQKDFAERFMSKIPQLQDVGLTEKDEQEYTKLHSSARESVAELKAAGLQGKLDKEELAKVNGLGVDNNVSAAEVSKILQSKGFSELDADSISSDIYNNKRSLEQYKSNLNDRFGENGVNAMIVRGGVDESKITTVYEAYARFRHNEDSLVLGPLSKTNMNRGF